MAGLFFIVQAMIDSTLRAIFAANPKFLQNSAHRQKCSVSVLAENGMGFCAPQGCSATAPVSRHMPRYVHRSLW